MEKNKKRLLINIAILVIYAIVHVILIQYHEAWRDEAHSWLQMQNLSFGEIVSDLSVDGHPLLWFVVMYPLIHLGLPFTSFSYVTLAVMIVAAALVLTKADFPYWVRVIIITSSVFVYYNAIVARIYALVVLVVVLAAAFWKERLDKPIWYGIIIALIFQSHILMAGLGIGLMLEMALECLQEKDKKKKGRLAAGTGIAFASLIAMIIELMQKSDVYTPYEVNSTSLLDNLSVENIIKGLDSVLRMNLELSLVENRILRYGLVAVTVLFVFAVIVWQIYLVAKNKLFSAGIKELLVIVCGLGAYFAIICLVRDASHEQLAICCLDLVLFSVWILYENQTLRPALGKALLVFVAGLSIITWIPNTNIIKCDATTAISDDKAMALYIAENVEEGAVVAVSQEYMCPGVCAYISCYRPDITLWDIDLDQEFTFYDFSIECPKLAMTEIFSRIEKTFGDKKIYYLSGFTHDETEDLKFVTSFENDNFREENYWLFVTAE